MLAGEGCSEQQALKNDFSHPVRYESNQKVLSKGSTHVLTSTAEEKEGGNATSHRGTPEPPRMGSAALSTTSRNILEKLKSIPQGRPGRNETVESPQGPRACFKCGRLNHFIRYCPHQARADQGNWRRAGRSQK